MSRLPTRYPERSGHDRTRHFLGVGPDSGTAVASPVAVPDPTAGWGAVPTTVTSTQPVYHAAVPAYGGHHGPTGSVLGQGREDRGLLVLDGIHDQGIRPVPGDSNDESERPSLRLRVASRPNPRWADARPPLPEPELRATGAPGTSVERCQYPPRGGARSEACAPARLPSRASLHAGEHLPASQQVAHTTMPGLPDDAPSRALPTIQSHITQERPSSLPTAGTDPRLITSGHGAADGQILQWAGAASPSPAVPRRQSRSMADEGRAAQHRSPGPPSQTAGRAVVAPAYAEPGAITVEDVSVGAHPGNVNAPGAALPVPQTTLTRCGGGTGVEAAGVARVAGRGRPAHRNAAPAHSTHWTRWTRAGLWFAVVAFAAAIDSWALGEAIAATLPDLRLH